MKDPKEPRRDAGSTPRLEYALMTLGIAVVGLLAFKCLGPQRAAAPSTVTDKNTKRLVQPTTPAPRWDRGCSQ